MITIGDTVKKFHSKEATEQAIRELIEYHVTKALEAASENADTIRIRYTNDYEIDKDSILTAYPLENIK